MGQDQYLRWGRYLLAAVRPSDREAKGPVCVALDPIRNNEWGLGQFFSNSTGVLAPEAAEGFEEIGMPNCASILRRSMQFFGDPYPRDRLMREQKLEDFHTEFGEDAIPLLEFEDAMATEIEDENGGFWNAANKYAEER